jgi:NAD(P)-dependent dehydrogenase (short-subunit alcohol dehydrogenase family)
MTVSNTGFTGQVALVTGAGSGIGRATAVALALARADARVALADQIPLMRRQGPGAIVNASSDAGVKSFRGQAAYAAAKHGVMGLTRSGAPLTTRRRTSESTPSAPASSTPR